MSEERAAEQGFLGGIRLGFTVLLAGFMPPFFIVWLLTSRSQNQLLAKAMGEEEQVRTLLDVVQPVGFAAAVAFGWVLVILILLLVLRSLGRFGDLRDLYQRRGADRALALDTKLPADAWGNAVVRRRAGASSAPPPVEEVPKAAPSEDPEPGT